MGEIKRPEGEELRRYVRDGYFICNKCGALMKARGSVLDPDQICYCPGCGWEIKAVDYRYEGESYDDEEEEEDIELDWAPGMDIDMNSIHIPPGCAACGGPYPQCTTSCKIFDD